MIRPFRRAKQEGLAALLHNAARLRKKEETERQELASRLHRQYFNLTGRYVVVTLPKKWTHIKSVFDLPELGLDIPRI